MHCILNEFGGPSDEQPAPQMGITHVNPDEPEIFARDGVSRDLLSVADATEMLIS
jgi:hypothetical protein